MAFQKYDFKKVGLGKKASAFDTYRELAANKPSVQDIVAPQKTVKSTNVPSQDPLETPYTVGATGGSQPSQPVDEGWKDSLAGINSYYEAGKPANGGTAEDMKNGVNHWQAYLDELDKFQAANGSNEDFDQTQFKLYRDYASNSLKNAQDSYAATLAQENAAQNSKMEQANMKEQALKYAQMSMDAQGLGSQGVNGSLQAGIGNQFAENSANIDKEKAEAQQSTFEQYQQMANDNKGRLEEELYNNEQNTKNDKFALANEMLQSAQTAEDIAKIKSQYYNDFTPEQKRTFDYYAEIAQRDIDAQDPLKQLKDKYNGQTAYATKNDFAGIKTTNGTDVLADKGGVKNELNYITTDKKFKESISNGMCVCLVNGKNEGSRLYLQFFNGYWYVTDADTFYGSSNQQTIRGK